MAIDSTVGTPTANSYASVAEADAYFVDMFNRPLWASAVQATKEALLVTASRTLDMYIDWMGYPVSDVQSMGWPRNYAYDKVGLAYSNSAIPMPVKFATYELAYYIIQNGEVSFVEQIVDEVKVGGIQIKFSDGSVVAGIPDQVLSLVQHIGQSNISLSGRAHTVRLVRV